MAWSLIASTIKAAGTNGGTTDAINTTDADLLIVIVHAWQPTPAPSDNKGNSFTRLTNYRSGNFGSVEISYSKPTTVGSGHTFTAINNNSFLAITAMAFSGSKATSPFDVENGNATTSTVTSRQPGSITPSENNELIISGIAWNGTGGGSPSIDSGMTIAQSLQGSSGQMGGAGAYLFQSVAAAINPTWSWTPASEVGVAIASFKGAADTPKRLALLGVG